MKKAAINKRTAALALSGAMGLSCLAGAIGMAFTDGKKVALAAGNVVSVDASKQYQTFDGWGTTLAWWANECGDWTREHSGGKTQRDYIMDLLFSEEGLNFNIARYNIGGGENPEHSHLSYDTNMPGFQYERNGAYDWENGDGTVKNWDETADARQLWVLNAFQNIRKDIAGEGKESDAITEFFSNSPPYWMLNNQCASGSGKTPNLKNDYITDYVNYFVDVYKYLIDQGFTIDLLQPFNESTSVSGRGADGGWGALAGNTGDQEGCTFSVDQKIQVLNGVMARVNELAQEDPKYAAGYNLGDEVDTGAANAEFGDYKTKSNAIYTGADKLTYHIYGYSVGGAQEVYRRAKANGQKAEMSEITWTVSGTYDPDLMDTALDKYSQSIIDIVKYGAAESYVYWQGMENLTGLIKTGWNYGLLHGVYDNPAIPSTVSGFDLASRGLVYQDVRTCKTYYVAGQYSKYIKAGYHIVEIDDDRSLAAISPDGDKLVIVKENNGAKSKSLNFNLNNFDAEKITKIYTDPTHNWESEEITGGTDLFKDTVTPYSVTTYVIDGESKAGSAHIIDESAAVNKTNFAGMQNEIASRGDKEGLFTAGTWKSQGKTQSFAGETIYNNGNGNAGNYYVAVRFYGTGIGVLAERKDGTKDTEKSAILQYWCDPTFTNGVLPATADGEVDTRNSTHLHQQQVLRLNGLTDENGEHKASWHTVYLKVKQYWLNLDGVFVINGEDKDMTAEKPVVTTAGGRNDTLYVNYTGIADVTGYTVKYKKSSDTNWTDYDAGTATSVKITDSSLTAEDYEVKVVATTSSGTVESNVYKNVEISMVPTGLLYYVDCATSHPAEGGWGRVFGICQSALFDKNYGADALTGLNWGLDSSTATAGWQDEDPFSSIYYGGGKKVVYKFTIPEADTYVLAVGGFRPEGWGERTLEISISGANGSPSGNLTANAKISSVKTIEFTTGGADQEITVTVNNPDGLSLMTITKKGSEALPIMANSWSNYTMNGAYDHSGAPDTGVKYLGEQLTPDASFSFELVMSDGTTKTLSSSKVASEELANVAEDEYYTVGYTANKEFVSGWNEKWPEMTVYAAYRLKTQKKITQPYEVISPEQLFYFIDSGSFGSSSAFTAGSLQTGGARDQKYTGSNTWGYVDWRTNQEGCQWKDDVPESSIREMDSGSGYVMTGFQPNQKVTLEVGMNCQNWSTRKAAVYVGGTYDTNSGAITGGTQVGQIEMVQNGGVKFGKYEVTADASGVLVVTFIKVSGDNAQIAYVKVNIPAVEQEEISSTLPTLPAIKVSQSAFFRQGFEGSEKITLSGLEVGATVYVLDSNDNLVDNFVATGATVEWNAWNKVPADAYGLRFSQAIKTADATSANGSPETVVALPRITITSDSKVVGGKVAIEVAPTLGNIPKEIFGSIDSIKIRRPDGVTADIIGSFFYRTVKNGEHTVTVTCNGVTYSQKFTVEAIETIDLEAEYSTTDWTDGNVTITLTPSANKGLEGIYVAKNDGEFTELELDAYVITATENAIYKVKVVSDTGAEKVFTYAVNNIDKSEPTLTITINYGTSGGVQFNYKSNMDGKLYVKKGTDAAVAVDTLGTFTATQTGEYEFYYVSATGKQTDSYTYSVAVDKTEATFGTVTVGEDGTVSVTGTGVTAKLYRAGNKTALNGLNVAKDGKYYLELTNASGEKEVVVIDTAEGSAADNVTVVQPPVTPSKNKGGSTSTDLILTIVFAVLAAAAVAGTIVIVIKRRKA